MKDSALRRFTTATIFAFLCANHPAVGWESPGRLESHVLAPAAIVIGFVGGLVRRNNAVHSEVQLATRLRKDYPSGVQVRMFENRQGQQAQREILRLLDVNQDGKLSAEESLMPASPFTGTVGVLRKPSLWRELSELKESPCCSLSRWTA